MTPTDYSTPQQPPYQPGYYNQQPQQRKSRWWIAVIAILGFLFVGIIILVVGFFALVGGLFESKPVMVKSQTVLRLNVPGYLQEYATTDPFSIFSSDGLKPVSYFDVLNAIKRAKDDANIEGIYYRSGDLAAGFAKATELREAMEDFKKSGKFIYAYLELGAESEYYLASVADSIFMTTEGMLELNGYAITELFWTGTYEKLGIDFHVQQFEEFKSAGETYIRRGFSEPARRELLDLLDQRYTTFVTSVAKSRSLSEHQVERALHRGIFSADTLLALGFIDGIRSESDIKTAMQQRIDHTGKKDSVETSGEKPRFISIKSYINSSSYRSSASVNRDKQIAVVIGSGMIVPGDTGEIGLFEESLLASDTFIRNLRKARDNSSVKAIILRIDSPGGSITASDVIWEEIRKTKLIKPIYASMSDLAASGGYYLAMACDTIIAHPATITGSIGVISVIPNFSATLDKIGADADTVTTNKSALFLNPYFPFSDRDKAILYDLSKNMYNRFVSRVAESRHKEFGATRAIAKGRVWTGEAGYRIGLVDTLGGLGTAIQMAKRRIGIPPHQKVRIRFYPEPVEPLRALLKLLGSAYAAKMGGVSQSNWQSQIPLWHLMPKSVQAQIQYLFNLSLVAKRERALIALPYLPAME